MQKLKEARKALHLTTEDVANKIGVTNATISRWENGKMFVSEERYRQLAEVYHCSVDDLRDPPSWPISRENDSHIVFGIDTIVVDDPKLGRTEFHAKSPDQADYILRIVRKLTSLSDENLIRLSERISMMLEEQEAK